MSDTLKIIGCVALLLALAGGAVWGECRLTNSAARCAQVYLFK